MCIRDSPEGAPVREGVEVGNVAGPDDEDVRFAHLNALCRTRVLKILGRDGVALLESLQTLQTRNVQENPTANEGVFHVVDRTTPSTGERLDVTDPETIEHRVLVEEVGHGVPLRAALEGHEDVVIGTLEVWILLSGDRPRHEVRSGVAVHVHDASSSWVDRTSAVERNGETEYLSGLNQLCRRGDFLGRQ